MREIILPWALDDTDLGDDVLEVGPGYGATTDVLSRAVPKLTSVEIDDELAAMLTDRFAEFPSVEIVNADATSLSYDDDRFSGAACFTMLHHVPTIELQDRLFAEIARVLRPGGRAVIDDIRHGRQYTAIFADAGCTDCRSIGSPTMKWFTALLTFGSLRPETLVVSKGVKAEEKEFERSASQANSELPP